jgi:hypothetical protein
VGGLTVGSAGLEKSDGAPVTLLVGVLQDQSALHGVSRRLHSFSSPLLFVAYMGPA